MYQDAVVLFMSNSESHCSCVGLSDHFCQCCIQFLVHSTVRYCKFCILTSHVFIALIASFVTSSQATLDLHTTTFLGLHHFISSSHNTPNARKKKENKCHFPTDPCYGVKISPTSNDLKALGINKC